jgi:FdrA protein
VTETVRVERGRYHDSVTLMRASAAGAAEPGVDTVIAAMATELNLTLLADAGFPAPDATPDDLVVAVRADVDAQVEAAVAAVEQALVRRAPAATGGARAPSPHTVEAAAAQAPDAGVVLVSVPGRHAYVEAAAALRAGRHVMVFSDGVPVADEVALKREAAGLGRLVMGPDCGTAVLGGVGLGFANVVAPGPVGVVAASGTGAQQLCCLLDGAGVGVRHVLGVGGRDLSAAVGGASALAALAVLDGDPAIEVIVVVSKPPAPEVAEAVAAAAAACRTPVVMAPVGPGHPTLTDVAGTVANVLGVPFAVPPPSADPSWWPSPAAPPLSPPSSLTHAPPPSLTPTVPSPPSPLSPPLSQTHAPPPPGPRSGPLLGLFSGGTDCIEALAVVEPRLGPVASNVHHDPSRRVGPHDHPADVHVLLDLGDDELTAGRPHPMIDPAAVAERLAAAATATGEGGGGGAGEPDRAGGPGVVLLDVVLGHGAHPDPASVLVPALAAARAAGLATVVSLVGTAGDPQGVDRQASALAAAGAQVYRSNAHAAARAAELALAATVGSTP